MGKLFYKQPSNKQGLTLIETVLAMFIMTMAVSAIVGTAIYSFGVNNRSVNQFQALNLAREAIEAARLQRDTNWLPPYAPYGRDGIDFCGDSSQPEYIGVDQYCYKEYNAWFSGAPIGLVCKNGTGCRLRFTPGQSGGANTSFSFAGTNYPLYQVYNDESGRTTYQISSTGAPPSYYRKIWFTTNTNAPYASQHPLITVKVTVAWKGPLCKPWVGNDPSAAQNCKVTVEESLTNWKNF